MKPTTSSAVIIAAGLVLAGCGNPSSAPGDNGAAAAPRQVELVTHHMDLQGPDSIPSGWTTFRFVNASGLTHFATIESLPEGIGTKEYRKAGRIYQRAMDLINAGKGDEAMKVVGSLPDWTREMVNVGGVGLTAPGHTAQETVYLRPGHYMVECYVKTDGVFHSYASPSHPPMIHAITVTSGKSGATPPTPDVRVTVSSEDGLRLRGRPAAGRQTFAVYFEKQEKNLMGADVHLFRVRGDADIDAANAWMDALAPDGLETPSPVEFLGGTEELRTGHTAYFTVTLEPGRYGLISEVADPRKRGLLATFEVPAPTAAD